ncbi:MAG: GtrA family protein [Anaerolineales bacterium]|nr:GtrA family protein [Anaerolineales bacterium]
MIVITDARERTRFIKFAAVGAIGAAIDFGVMNLLSHRPFEFSLVVAGSVSFVCAVISNFVWNRYWTYPESRSRPILNQLGMFFLVNAAGILIRVPILRYLEPPLRAWAENLLRAPSAAEFYAKNLTLAIAVGVVMLWNFFVNRYWTYNDVDNES